ncbi:MAG TPA: S8 family serine peptidase [Candidatus Eisenbacteria bacterium]
MRRLAACFGLGLIVGIAMPRPGDAASAPWVESHAQYAPPASRAPQVLTENSLSRLRAEGRPVLWVFFTDKREGDAASFARSLQGVGARVTEHARARRARETGGRFVPDYYDLPVAAGYVDAVARTGAAVRHVSRWLNGMTVEADEAEARLIAALPFVRVVTPARRSRRVAPVPDGAAPPAPPSESPRRGEGLEVPPIRTEIQGSAPTLPKPTNYGASATALGPPAATGFPGGINAIAAHDSGWSGATVIVGMFDSGFDKSHNATSPLLRIAEYDFVFHDGETANQPGDVTGAWDHGTGTWSVLGGYFPVNMIGPAFNARFLLAKTEDIRSETPVEEDNWVAAAEWADSIGADVISSSLAYFDFDGTANDYTYANLDGHTTVVTLGALMAARRGIVVANAMGNTGGALGSLWAPADADSILSCGAVDAGNSIAPFSSRGPTSDGRTKPEVVAQGVGTSWAVAGMPSSVVPASGTSLSTPLVGGAAALVREAHPEWTAAQVRQALMTTADKAATPDNNYGWGRLDVVKAIYGSSLGGIVAPKPFNLLVPINNGTVSKPPNVTFLWRRAFDPQGSPVSYKLQLRGTAPDSSIFEATTTETTVVYTGYLGPSKVYEWTVTAIDPQLNERVSKDRFRFTTTSTTDVGIPPPAPPRVTLFQNHPNPLRTSTQIDFSMVGPAGSVPVTLRIFDLSGRLIRTLVDSYSAVPNGWSVQWDGLDGNGRRSASGIYYYQLVVGRNTYSRSLVLLR